MRRPKHALASPVKTLALAAIGIFAVGLLALSGQPRSQTNATLPDADPLSEGCRQVNRGGLDLHVRIDGSPIPDGLMGSGFVEGFRLGERLIFKLSAVGHAPSGIRVKASLEAIKKRATGATAHGPRQHALISWNEAGPAAGEKAEWPAYALTITKPMTDLVVFTSSFGEGTGAYRLIVHCEIPSVS